MDTNYDPTDKDSIFKYAQRMKRMTFREIVTKNQSNPTFILEEDNKPQWNPDIMDNLKHKGNLGDLIEEHYFHYKVDSAAQADFPDAKVELKVTPYKINKNGSISAKERLVISMINYFNIVNQSFYKSNAWEKIENILLVYYLWEVDIKDRLDYTIDFIYMHSPSLEDLEIIKSDYNQIKHKILEGKAHELSEGDTLYLGAATKASNSRDRTQQPFNIIPAKPRAFSLKTSYMTQLLRNHIKPFSDKNDKILKQGAVLNFESHVLNKINHYIGYSDVKLFKLFFDDKKITSKNKYSRLAYELLDVKTKNAEEFEKANIVVKAIRVEENNSIRESMSFPYFKILDLIDEDWEDSSIKNMFEQTKFLFIVYKKKGNNYYLKGSKFWNMPVSDIEGNLETEWKKIKKIFEDGIVLTPVQQKTRIIINNNLPKKSETEIVHVRPHANKSAYLINEIKYGSGNLEPNSDTLPNGDRMTKQCFWLNNSYVLKQIKDLVI